MGVDWAEIDRKYPSKLDKNSMSDTDYRKERTLELYSYLPQTTLEERATYTDIRDAVFELNYKFFGYLASHHYIANNYSSYEDKFNSAGLHFLEMWHKGLSCVVNMFRENLWFRTKYSEYPIKFCDNFRGYSTVREFCKHLSE